MYIIKNDHRKAYLTSTGWTTIEGGTLRGLHDVLRFTAQEVELNKDTLPHGSRFIHFPKRNWRDYDRQQD